MRYRKAGASEWAQGLDLWYDPRANECRGSIVHLAPGVDYEAEMSASGTKRGISFRTWANKKPVAKVIPVASGTSTLEITEGGSASGWVVYEGTSGAVWDAGNAVDFNVKVNASYVIVRNLVLKGAKQDAIRISPDVTDVIIEDNEITGWGRQRSGSLGVDMDSAVRAVCKTPTMSRVTVQRNEIHDPRYSTNSWSDGHPAGPQAVTFSYCGGNHVIRHNEIFSTAGNYYNDILGGEDNMSDTGFPNSDSDIYGNELSHAWDDAIEAEGANNNVRIWGNYIDQTGTGVASSITSVGPLYIFRNVWNRGRMLEKAPLDADDRNGMFKAGSEPGFANGRRYIFHNTMLQQQRNGNQKGLGGANGIVGNGNGRSVRNTVSRNNIFEVWKDTSTAYSDVAGDNDFEADMFSGKTAGASLTNGIHAKPRYKKGHGPGDEVSGMYELEPGTPGADQGVRIPNFNDAFVGAAPDVGAAEGGAGRMRFGIGGS